MRRFFSSTWLATIALGMLGLLFFADELDIPMGIVRFLFFGGLILLWVAVVFRPRYQPGDEPPPRKFGRRQKKPVAPLAPPPPPQAPPANKRSPLLLIILGVLIVIVLGAMIVVL